MENKNILKIVILGIFLFVIPYISANENYTLVSDAFYNFSTIYNSEGVYNNGSSLIIGNINGSIDDLMIWNRELSANEINLLYQGSFTKFNSSYYNYQTTQTDGQTCYTDGILQSCSGQPVPHVTSGNIKYLTDISGGTKWEFDDNIEPKVTNLKSIGSSLFRWLKGWFVDIDASGNIKAGGTINSTGLITGQGFNDTGNSTINNYYGGMYSSSETGIGGITLNATYQIVNFSTANSLNGFNFVSNDRLQLIDVRGVGIYKIDWHTEKDGMQNHIYYGEVFVNGVSQNNTLDRSVGQASNAMRMSGFGFVRLDNLYDNVTLRVSDTSGTSTPTVYVKNINLVRIGN